MKFRIETQDLSAAVSTVTRALSTRTPIKILEGIYIEASQNTVLLRCTDLSLQIDAIVAADVQESGAAVMPGKLFAELVRKLPGEYTDICLDKNSAAISSGRAKTNVQVDSAKDYHSMPPIKKDYELTMGEGDFCAMIGRCTFATAQDDAKPILTGVLMEMEPEKLSMIALDGYRLALTKENVRGGAGEGMGQGSVREAVLPGKSLMEISRLLGDTTNLITLNFSRTHMLIDLGFTRIITRLLDGEYIKYRQILPETHSTRVRLRRGELYESIERVSLIARENKSNLVRFRFSGESLFISANSEMGRSEEDIPISLMGTDIEIAFNARYFLDILRVIDDEEIFLDMNNNISPCVVRPIQGEEFYYLVLPVRLFSGV